MKQALISDELKQLFDKYGIEGVVDRAIDINLIPPEIRDLEIQKWKNLFKLIEVEEGEKNNGKKD